MFLVSRILDIAAALGGPRIALDIQLWRLERWHLFEPEYFLLDHLVDPRRAAIDVGGNEGIYSGRLAQLCSRVHCFEPIPWMAADLRKKLKPNVTVHEAAVSDVDGTAELRIPYRDGMRMHGLSTIAPANSLEGATRTESVQCSRIRLDTVINEPIGFIKIDVEGHEMAVLRGAEKIISRDRPVLIVESEKRHSPEAPEDVIGFMTALGYGGLFLLDGLPKMISAFRTPIHQPRESIQGTEKVGPYVNNFIFISN